MRERSGRGELFELLNYKNLLSGSTAFSAKAIARERKDIRVGQQQLLQMRNGREELDILRWRTCGDTMCV